MQVCPECGLRFESAGFCPTDGTPLAPRGEDLLLGEQLGQYRVTRILGVGGMGRVYRAVQPQIGSRVAIKVLSRECADKKDLVERFFAEARAVNLIRHENIVNVMDLAQLADGRPYIVMEYLDGAPLAHVMSAHRTLPLGSLARLAGEVLGALNAAHAAGIVHRDLKPDNIFVSPQGRAKVLDFGIAKLLADANSSREHGAAPTRTGSLLGTPHYMSPEQATAKAVDARADIYAMGVILYEGATGSKPFVADSLFDLLRKQVEEIPAPPRTLRTDLPTTYDALIMRALEKSPAERFQSATQMAHALAVSTQALPQAAWASVGVVGDGAVGSASSMSSHADPQIGPNAVPTPSSAPPAKTPGAVGLSSAGVDTDAPTHLATPLPTPQANVVTEGAKPRSARAARHSNRKPVVITAVLGAAAIAVAVAVIVLGGGGETDSSEHASTTDKPNPTAARASLPAAAPTQEVTPNAADAGASGGGPAADPRTGHPDAGTRPNNAKTITANLASDNIAPTQSVPTQIASTAPTRKTPTSTPQQPPNVPIQNVPAARTKKARSKGSAFDVTGYIPIATRRARAIYADAILVRIDADGVYPSGKADLTLSDKFNVLYRFVSPSRNKRPADLPLGVEHKPNCKVYVNVSASGSRAYPLKGWKCDEPLIGPPKCGARKIWRKAIGLGAPAKNAVGALGYWADSRTQKGRWHFSVGKAMSRFIDDDC